MQEDRYDKIERIMNDWVFPLGILALVAAGIIFLCRYCS